MSDPVTNIEIEDVLSSIRRLVAEGDKLRAPAAPREAPLTLDNAVSVPASEPEPEPEPAPEPVSAGKFVLTASHRVDTDREPPAAEAAPRPEDTARTEPPKPAPTVLLWDEEAAEAPSGAMAPEAESDAAPEAGPEGSDVAASPADDLHEAWDADPENIASLDDTWPPEDDAAGLTDEPAPYVAAGRSRLESTIAELEAAITGQPDEFEPDGSEDTPQMDWSDGAAQATFLSARTIHRASPIEDAEEMPPRAGSAPPKAAPAQAMPEAREALDGDLEQTLTAYLEEEEILDEETLRNLVTEIVHQELQGALGERITRNVRKLVRREIHRAMTSQEFE